MSLYLYTCTYVGIIYNIRKIHYHYNFKNMLMMTVRLCGSAYYVLHACTHHHYHIFICECECAACGSIILGLCYVRRDVVVLSLCVFVHNNNFRSSIIIIIIFCWFWVVVRRM